MTYRYWYWVKGLPKFLMKLGISASEKIIFIFSDYLGYIFSVKCSYKVAILPLEAKLYFFSGLVLGLGSGFTLGLRVFWHLRKIALFGHIVEKVSFDPCYG